MITKELAEGVNAFQKGKYNEAFTLLLPFAEQGELRAQLILARLYYAGHGVQRDEDKYLYWLRRSADSGDKSAKSIIKRIDRNEYTTFSLTEEQVERFRLFGYLRLPGFFSSDIIEMSALFEQLMAGAGKRGGQGEGGDTAPAPANLALKVQDWLPDPATSARLDLVALTLLGRHYTDVASQLSIEQNPQRFVYGGAKQAQRGSRKQGIRALTCLDRGALMKVFPGSHHARDAYTRSLRDAIDAGNDEERYAPGPDHEGVELRLTAGDLILLHSQLANSLVTGRKPLRLIHIEYETPITLWDHLRSLFGPAKP